MNARLVVVMLFLVNIGQAATNSVTIDSPSGKVHAEILTRNGKLTYSVLFNGKAVVSGASAGIMVDETDYSNSTLNPDSIEIGAVDQTYSLLGVKSTTRNVYTETRIPLTTTGTHARWTLDVRAYDDGFAFRYIIPGEGARSVSNEATSFVFPDESTVWFFERNNSWKLKSYAGEWISAPISRMPEISKTGPIQGLPLVVQLPQGGYALLTEAACWNYSGLRCKAVGAKTFTASLADESLELGGEITTPWRVVLCAVTLDEMVNSTIVKNLASEPDPVLYSDTAYIRPGRSVWRWWSSGTGTPEEERKYIDYAARLGFEYTTVDDGWEKWPNAWEEITRLCIDARDKGVGVFVWKDSNQINDPSGNWKTMRAFFDRVKTAGAVGIKIDFINSESKAAIDFEIAALRLAAQRKLLINFHGCRKPTGEARAWPNEITREGIRGLELNKMKEGPVSASHNAALPFTRFVVGHADYTPFTVTPGRLGPTTVTHQLATVVCFTSPLQTIAENPAVLFRPEWNEMVAVLKQIPAVWDETNVLPGSRIGDLAVMARRKGHTWFVAALNGSGSRDYALDLSFLDGQKYSAVLIQDEPDEPARFKTETRNVDRQSIIDMHMNKGGGFVLLLQPLKSPPEMPVISR